MTIRITYLVTAIMLAIYFFALAVASASAEPPKPPQATGISTLTQSPPRFTPETSPPVPKQSSPPIIDYPPSSGVHPNFSGTQTPMRWNGGVVQRYPHVYVIFWGSDWNSLTKEKEAILNFYKWLPGSEYAGILTQMFDANGPITTENALSASYTDTESTHPINITPEKIINEIQQSITNQKWGTPTYENQYVVFTPGKSNYSFGIECGMHQWSGEPQFFAWADVPWQPASCDTNSLEQRYREQTTAAHEWSEAVTDPIPVSGSLAWSNIQGEIADRCQGYFGGENVEAAAGIWVQRIFDNSLNAKYNSEFYCNHANATPYRYTVASESPVVTSVQHATLHGKIEDAGYFASYRWSVVHGGTTEYFPSSTFTPITEQFGDVDVSNAISVKGNTTYQVNLESKSLLTHGQFSETEIVTLGGEKVLTTPDWRPAVTTETASSITSTGATLNGTVNPNGSETKYFFEYGPKTSYGTKTAEVSVGSGTSALKESKAISGLEFGATYHFRIGATNAEGTVYGADQVFTPGWSIQSTLNPPGAKEGRFEAVSCTSSTACTATGYYENSSSIQLSLAEQWNGTTWAIQSTPNPSGGTRVSLKGVSCPSSMSCMAAGNSIDKSEVTTTLAERWNGTEWKIQSTPNPAGTTRSYLAGVSCTSSTSCTATGYYQNSSGIWRTLAENWNGTSWTIQTTVDPTESKESYLYGISCTSSSACTATGFEEDKTSAWVTLAERWDGTKWTIQTTPNPEGAKESYLYGVSCTTSTSCMATGNYINGAGAEQTLTERWDGVNWNVQAPPNPDGEKRVFTRAISCTSSTACTTAGTYQNSSNVFLTLAEGYFKYPLPTAATKPATGVNETGATLNGTVNPNGSETKYFFEYGPTTSYGTNTAEVSAGSGTSTLEVSKAVSGLEAGTQYHFRIVASNGGGTTKGEDQVFTPGWILQTTPNPEGSKGSRLEATSCTASSACTAVGHYENSSSVEVTLAERWNGSTWAIQSTPNPSEGTRNSLKGVSCTSSTECTAVGSYRNTSSLFVPLAERWNGSTWAIQSTPSPEGSKQSFLEAVSCTSSTECTAVGNYTTSTEATRTLAERWNGTKWEVQSTPNPEGTRAQLVSVSCTSSSVCTATGFFQNGSGVWRTLAERWNGTTWTIQSTSDPAGSKESYLYGVSCTSSSACTASGYFQNSSSVWVTLAERWNGSTWEIQTTPNPEGAKESYLYGVSCTTSTACMATGYYRNSSSVARTLAENWNGTSWTVQTTPNPTGAKETYLPLLGVSCTSPTTCRATGYYQNSSGVFVTLAEGY